MRLQGPEIVSLIGGLAVARGALRETPGPIAGDHFHRAQMTGDGSVTPVIARIFADELHEAEVAARWQQMPAWKASKVGGVIHGVCFDCKQEIGVERLRAKPSAIRCRSCQEAYEG